VTSPHLVEKLIPRNNALCVLDHELQEFEFQWRQWNHAAFSSQLHIAKINSHSIKSEGVPGSGAQGPMHRHMDAR
jgi:hypothetical protein